MKKLLLLLFIPLVFACSDDVKNNLDNQNLNGNVESLKQIKYGVIEKWVGGVDKKQLINKVKSEFKIEKEKLKLNDNRRTKETN